MFKNWNTKLNTALSLALLLALAVTIVALADNVVNDVTVGGTDTFTAGGTTSVGYQIVAAQAGGDPQQGCNAADSSPATVTINVPPGVSATPGSLTFTTCNDFQDVTFSSSTPGNYNITVSVSDSGAGTYRTLPAALTLHVLAAADTTPPDVTVPVDMTVEATGPSGASVSFSASANDDVDGALTPTCVPASGSTFPLGTTKVICSATDAAGTTGSASFNITVVDTTAPALTLPADITAEATGSTGAVVTFSTSASDLVDGALTPTCVPASGSTFPLGATSVSCSATDAHSNAASGNFTITVVDTTPPVITFDSRTLANGNGWNNADVTVVWSCSDLVGVVSPTVSTTVSTEGENQSATGTCEDTSGNTTSDTQSGINIDKTAPTASASASPAPNANGWNNTNVTVSFSGNDGTGSGIDFCDAAVVLSSEGAGQSASGTCTDKAGNVSALATASGINIDKTAPTVSLVGGPADGGSYYFGFVPAAPTCSASDALSGLDGSCSVSGYSAAVGSHTVIASATDKAGNSASASATYTVLAWTLSGFYQPVDMGTNVWNTVKGGSTVPLKFEVFAGGTELTDTTMIGAALTATQAPCSGGTEDSIEVLATGGTSLRYDMTSGQFIFNWQTPKKPGFCYAVTMTTQDGSTLKAFFKLK